MSVLKLTDLLNYDDFSFDDQGMLRGSTTVNFDDFIMTGAADLDRLMNSSITYKTSVHCNPAHLSAEEYFKQKDPSGNFNLAYGLESAGEPVKEWGEAFERKKDAGFRQTMCLSLVVEQDNETAGHILLQFVLSEPEEGENAYYLEVDVPLIYIVPVFRHKNLWMPLYTVAYHLIYSVTSESIEKLPKDTRLNLTFHADYDSIAGERIGNGLFGAMEIAWDISSSEEKKSVSQPEYDAGF